jgi:hypothetical protein
MKNSALGLATIRSISGRGSEPKPSADLQSGLAALLHRLDLLFHRLESE